MNQPTECEYCRCSEVLISSEAFVYFRCGTAYWPGTSQWTYANKCVETRVKKLEERVKRAVEVLEGGDRIMMMLDDDDEDVSFVVPATDVDRAVGILEGEEDDDSNSSKSSNSSPITTNDLAASDYFEAVRQRVPWMTSIEHIEGLVEGYRQCGLMVWKAAQQIKLIFGGGNGQTE